VLWPQESPGTWRPSRLGPCSSRCPFSRGKVSLPEGGPCTLGPAGSTQVGITLRYPSGLAGLTEMETPAGGQSVLTHAGMETTQTLKRQLSPAVACPTPTPSPLPERPCPLRLLTPSSIASCCSRLRQRLLKLKILQYYAVNVTYLTNYPLKSMHTATEYYWFVKYTTP